MDIAEANVRMDIAEANVQMDIAEANVQRTLQQKGDQTAHQWAFFYDMLCREHGGLWLVAFSAQKWLIHIRS